MLFFVNVSQPKFNNDLIIIKVDDTRKIIIIYHIDRNKFRNPKAKTDIFRSSQLLTDCLKFLKISKNRELD